jgi:hypothetical protein
MKPGEFERQVRETDARTELIGVGEQPLLVEAQTAVDDEVVGDLPFVLRVNAGEIAGL